MKNQPLTRMVGANQMQKMQMIALDLVKYHLGKGWAFNWRFEIKASGSCWNHRALIEVSVRDAVRYGLDEFVETVLHEIAHALCDDRSNGGHNAAWLRIYRSIDGNGTVTTAESIAWESKHRASRLIERGFSE